MNNTEILVKKRVEDILTEIGIPCNLAGYDQIVTGVFEIRKDPKIRYLVTKELYPRIAQKHGTRGSRVERNVRHAIEVGWDRTRPSVVDKYFGNSVSIYRGKPTNSEFFSQLYRIINREEEENEMG